MMITASNVADFYDAGDGHFWWHDPATDAHLISDVYEPPVDGAVYLMPWDNSWFAQWDGDWEAATEQLNSLIDEETV
ncbi:hypothetical protein KNU62_gp35 [Gordonia phage Bakery]|uniref:Uncharacterized protein n=1 Tax=Gordonia phage Bakery TaxID=2591205 RepID=A0A514DGT2_9CAUD|nr:hypothetical protein KNU62_gp35 [Gordonia phage Bakery]QDH92820.1 hypothetical protein SEA_BAKERY_35 [Gordonia phage Bakery]